MPFADEHIKKYQNNIKFYNTISDLYPDWQITSIFYASLHYVNAFLHDKFRASDIDIASHKKLDEFLACVCENELMDIYDELKNLSYQARYDWVDLSCTVKAAQIKMNDIKKYIDTY